MKIIVVSYKRANKVYSMNLCSGVFCAVGEKEVKDYSEFIDKKKIIAIPDDHNKNICYARNWLLDNINEKYLLMIDDDIKSIGYWESNVEYQLSKVGFEKFVENGFVMCEEAKTILWGMNLQTDKKFYREYAPFSFLKIVTNTFFGVINVDKEIRYDVDLYLKEDYDFSLQVLKKYGRILRFNKYHYLAEHINMEGGCSSYRTLEKELEHAKMFQEKWGSKVVQINRETQMGNKSINPIVRVPLKGI